MDALSDLLPHIDLLILIFGAGWFLRAWRKDAALAAERDEERDKRTLEALQTMEQSATTSREAVIGAIRELSDQQRRGGERSGVEHKELLRAIEALRERVMVDNHAHAQSHTKIETMILGMKKEDRK